MGPGRWSEECRVSLRQEVCYLPDHQVKNRFDFRGKGVIMDNQKKESSPGTQSSGKTPGFKIPKKKPDDWCEDIPMSSPLSRVQDGNLRNVTFRRKQCGSSYETYNVPRNKDTRGYSMRINRQPKIILVDILRSDQGKQAAYKNISGSVSCNDGQFQITPVSSAPHTHPRAPESLCVSRYSMRMWKVGDTKAASLDSSEQYRERESGTKCEARSPVNHKEQRRSPSSKVCRDVSNTSISSNSEPKKSSSLDQESQEASKAQEQKNSLKGIEVSPAKREKTYCYKRVEHQNKKTSPSPSTHPSSSSTEPFTDRTLPCTLDSPSRKNIAREKLKETTEECKKSSSDGCSSDAPSSSSPSGTRSRAKRKMLTTTSSMKMVPIVLSSDEDEAAQKEARPGCTPPVKKSLVERKCPSPIKNAEPMEHSDSEEASTAPEQSDSSVLQLQFLNIYYGKKRGRVSDLAKFSGTSIEIPLKVPLHKITSLSVETRKLQKYGLWLTSGGDSVRSSAVIILWMTPGYVPVIEKQMELYAKNQACKSNEFIFLELVEPLTGQDQSLMSEIMVEASKHGLPSLAEVLSMEEICSILASLPSEDCSFKLNCCSAGSQPPEAKKIKSTYSLMQKWSNGRCSLSMVPEQHNVLSEAHRSEVPIRLLVYPPPPTKGGLAVSNEDLECLEHGEFLNDVIIDFYLKYLMLEIFQKPFADRCHIFSSFFFKCLTRKEKSSNDTNPDISTAERRHQRVKNWTRHVDIFTKDFIFVPVNENSHWYLAVICFPWLERAVYEDKKEQDLVTYSKTKNSGSVIVFNDLLSNTEELTEDSNSGSEDSCSSGPSYNRKYPKPKSRIGKVCKRPCILIFDSLTTGSVRTTVQVLREYLKVEYQVKKKSEKEFSRFSMRELFPKVPKQNNSTDCGLYLLQYVESFSQNPIENFESPMHLENWFPSCLVKSKREEIRNLILRLHVQQTKKC
ncbi:sentrin-specific protease 7 [Mantella aurantiaca]